MASFTPDPNTRALADLKLRVRQLEIELAGFREITGVCTLGPQMVVPVLSSDYDGPSNTFNIVFTSIPGEVYQIQTGVDAVNWTIAVPSVPAAAAPAVSTSYLLPASEPPFFFRVRRYPSAMPVILP